MISAHYDLSHNNDPPDSSVRTGRGPKQWQGTQWCHRDTPIRVVSTNTYLSSLNTDDSSRNLRSLISCLAATSFLLFAIASFDNLLFTCFSRLI